MGKKKSDPAAILAQVMGAADVAERLGVIPQRVNTLAREGRLISAIIGGNTRIFWAPDVEAFARLKRPAGHPPKKAKK